MEQRFAPALRTLQKLLQETSAALKIPISFALIGGLAVSAWGMVRATEDIDLLADSSPSPLRNPTLQGNVQRHLEKRGCRVEWRIGDPDDPIPLLLRVGLPKPLRPIGADILWAHRNWHREALARRIIVRISRLQLYVLHPEDLILMKLDAGGPLDLLDVERLLSNSPPELNLPRLERKASQLQLDGVLNQCLHGTGQKRQR